MRCTQCAWIIDDGSCACDAPSTHSPLPTGTRVVARPARGSPVAIRWEPGEVTGTEGSVYRVATRQGPFLCEDDDLLPACATRSAALEPGARVWALWFEGRFHPGTIDRVQGDLRHVRFDDGDSMWVEAHQCALLRRPPPEPATGMVVLAHRWDGARLRAAINGRDGDAYQVTFADGEEGSVSRRDLLVYPPNPFA